MRSWRNRLPRLLLDRWTRWAPYWPSLIEAEEGFRPFLSYEYAQSTRRADFEAALVSVLGDTHIWLMAVDGNFDQIIDEINEFAKERNNHDQ